MKKAILSVTLCFIVTIIYAQEIDLGVKSSNPSIVVESGQSLKIHLRNRSLKVVYRILVERKQGQADMLAWPSTEASQDQNFIENDPCKNLITKLNTLLSSTDEEKIRAGRIEIVSDALYDECSNKLAPKLAAFDTTITVENVKPNETITVTITQALNSDKKWTLVAKSNPHGFWKTTYGFSFATQAFATAGKYYLNASNTITKEASGKALELDYLPSIFFSYIPYKNLAKNWTPSLSAGLGIDFNVNPAVFLSLGFIYRENVALHLGLTAYKMDHLKGRYREGDIISEQNFDEDNLHTKSFRVNPFIGVSFNITNPNRNND